MNFKKITLFIEFPYILLSNLKFVGRLKSIFHLKYPFYFPIYGPFDSAGRGGRTTRLPLPLPISKLRAGDAMSNYCLLQTFRD